jgi:hypothetical protein
MKKAFTLFCTLVVALALALPASAKKHNSKKGEKAEVSQTNGKAHKKHASKKGASKGKKEGQQGAAPGPAK